MGEHDWMPDVEIPSAEKLRDLAQQNLDKTPTERPRVEGELADWWRGLAEDDLEATVPKMEEYGAADLVTIGRTMADIGDMEVSDSEAAALGTFFYLEGKMARAKTSFARGEMPKEDTLLDIRVYSYMLARIAEHGGWE